MAELIIIREQLKSFMMYGIQIASEKHLSIVCCGDMHTLNNWFLMKPIRIPNWLIRLVCIDHLPTLQLESVKLK